ncbi:MAG: DUF5615 family PIN-like protein [bacterium]
MLKFVVDEDIPRSTSTVLLNRSFEVLDARDCGLRGKSDKLVYSYAQKEEAVVFTADLGFGNLLNFPVGTHLGIVVVHFPNEVSVSEMNKQIGAALDSLSEDDVKGNLVVIEPGKIRIRRRRK